jgi:hypothetical protein
MALAFDAASTAKISNNATTITWSHTCTGSELGLLVGVSYRNDVAQTITGVTYNGVAMTSVGTIANGGTVAVDIWKLSAPASGAHNVVVTFSANVGRAVTGAVSFTGAHQTTASLTGTFASATGTSTAPSVAVTSAAGEIVLDTVGINSSTVDATVGAGQTSLWNDVTANGGADKEGAGSTEAGAASVTMSWTTGSSHVWAIGGVSVVPAVAAAASTAKNLLLLGVGGGGG